MISLNSTYDYTINLYINLQCKVKNIYTLLNSKTFATSNYIET